jgi:alpha-tubulin suppressor-like RCC1 family protein
MPARLSGLAAASQTWLAACLLAACGESNSPSEPSGQIRVASSTTGLSVDPDGYTVVLDDGDGHPIPINGTLLLEEVAPGNHTLTLTGVARNCRIEGEQPVTVLVNAGATTDASFTVTCDAAALAFRLVSSGWYHGCGVTPEDKVYCWGDNYLGQLGIDTRDGPEQCDNGAGDMWGCSSRPVAVLTELRFPSISAGGGFTCGVTTDNRAYCWGGNDFGQLGNGTPGDRSTPVAVAGTLSFQQVSAGQFHTCGVTTDNRAYCWGHNYEGQLGDGSHVERSTPVAVAGTLRFRQVSADGHHTCGITTDSLAFCWGANSSGQLGDSTLGTWRPLPVRVAGGHYFSQLDAGNNHTCAVTAGSRAFCWGQGMYGQLGNGGTEGTTWPMAVAGGLSFDRVTAGVWHSCGVTTDKSAYCWGVGASGELGNGTTTGPEFCDLGQWGQFVCSTVPLAVVGGHSFAQVDVSMSLTCARTGANVAYCWGATSFGQLGNGERDYGVHRATPTPVLGPR